MRQDKNLQKYLPFPKERTFMTIRTQPTAEFIWRFRSLTRALLPCPFAAASLCLCYAHSSVNCVIVSIRCVWTVVDDSAMIRLLFFIYLYANFDELSPDSHQICWRLTTNTHQPFASTVNETNASITNNEERGDGKNALSQIKKEFCAHDDTIQMNTASALVHTNTDSFLVCCELSCDWHCCCCCCCFALLLSLHYYYCHFYFFFFPLSSNVDVARTVIAQFSLLYSHHITEMLSTHLLLLIALCATAQQQYQFSKFAGPVREKR